MRKPRLGKAKQFIPLPTTGTVFFKDKIHVVTSPCASDNCKPLSRGPRAPPGPAPPSQPLYCHASPSDLLGAPGSRPLGPPPPVSSAVPWERLPCGLLGLHVPLLAGLPKGTSSRPSLQNSSSVEKCLGFGFSVSLSSQRAGTSSVLFSPVSAGPRVQRRTAGVQSSPENRSTCTE